MKNICLVLICLSVLYLTGCGDASPEQLLAYQIYPLRMTADYTCGVNDYSVQIEMTAPHTGCVTYVSPPSLAGLIVSVGTEAVTLSGYGFDIPLPATGAVCDSEIICAMLSLSPDGLISTELRDGQTPLSVALFKSGNGNIELMLDSSCRPLRLFAAEYDITLKSMILSEPPV